MMLTNAIRNMTSPWIELIRPEQATRSSVGWAWGSDQLLDEYAADELRRDYDPATGVFRGVLVEEIRTNQLLDNRDLLAGSWGTIGSPVANQDEIGIDGASNIAWTVTQTDSSSDLFQQTGISIADDNSYHSVSVAINIARSDATGSRFVFALDGGSTNKYIRIDFDASNESYNIITNDGEVEVVRSGDWLLVFCVLQNNSSGNTNALYRLFADRSGSGGSVVYDFGQVELNADTPSSLIETDGTATTRAADVLEGTFSESSGTLHFVGEHKGGDGVLWQADDGTENNRMRFEVSGGNVLFVVDDGGTNQVSLNAGALASDGTFNVAARFDGSDFAVSLDGAASVTSSSGTMPSLTTQRFGRDTSATAGLNWYETANHRSDKLTDSGLEALTA